MPIQAIRFFPDPVLRKVCEKVRRFDRTLSRILHDMRATMKAQPHGIGIAAPQIGIPQQIAIVDLTGRIPSAKALVLVNPEILNLKEERASREGCMSLPDYTGNLKRYDWVRLRWQDETAHFHEGEFMGIEGICIQHEIDHLQGKLFIDRVVSLKRDLIPRPRIVR